jgi:hypothetical protein
MSEISHNDRLERPIAPPDASTSTWRDTGYSLRFAGWPSLNQLVAVAVATAVYTVLSWLTFIAFPSPFYGVSSFFLAIGFGIAFGLWFGGWAFVIAYIGNFVGAGLLATPPVPLVPAIPFGATDFIQIALPMICYRLLAPRLGLSAIGKDVYTVKGFLFFAAVMVVFNVLGGLYGNYILVAFQLSKPELLLPGWFSWSISNVIVTIVIGSVLLRTLGPIVERFGLTMRNLLN